MLSIEKNIVDFCIHGKDLRRDLYEKHNKREEYKGLYSVGKKVYRDDGEIDNVSFAIDKENLLVLKARIDAILIDDVKLMTTNTNQKKLTAGRQAKLT